MSVKKRTKEILGILDDMYGTEDIIYLEHETDWQLLIATILSAQCTDARVNIVTRDLFVKYPTLQTLPMQVTRNWSRISVPLASSVQRQKI